MILSLFWKHILLNFSKYHSICSIVKVLVNISCGFWRFPAGNTRTPSGKITPCITLRYVAFLIIDHLIFHKYYIKHQIILIWFLVSKGIIYPSFLSFKSNFLKFSMHIIWVCKHLDFILGRKQINGVNPQFGDILSII